MATRRMLTPKAIIAMPGLFRRKNRLSQSKVQLDLGLIPPIDIRCRLKKRQISVIRTQNGICSESKARQVFKSNGTKCSPGSGQEGDDTSGQRTPSLADTAMPRWTVPGR